MNFYIRPAVPGDAEKCADIHIRSWEFAYGDFIPKHVLAERAARRPSQWERLLNECQDIHYVAVYNDKIIGIITIDPPRDEDLSEDFYELSGLYLDPTYIGKGLGKLTMDWIKNEISQRGHKHISLWVLANNARAKRFYEKSGFKADGSVQESGIGETMSQRFVFDFNSL